MIKDILKTLEDENVKIIRFKFVDTSGRIYGMSTTRKKLKKVLHSGISFDSSSIPKFSNIYESDMKLFPDPDTFKVLPYERKEASFICDIKYPDGKQYEKCTRTLLKNKLHSIDYKYIVKAELEYYLIKDGKPLDDNTYLNASFDDTGHRITEEIVLFMESIGMDIEKFHHENGRGQYEIEFFPKDALTIADEIVLFKEIAERIADKYGVQICFLPKPFMDEAGSGMHFHQILIKNGKNIFYEKSLTEKGKKFISGQLKHASALTRILNPTENSYKRLKGGEEAPRYICWGYSNRSALIRVPPSGSIEIRSPDPMCNPYLAFSALLDAGFSGDEDLPPVQRDVYNLSDKELREYGIEELPGTLKESEEELKKDLILKEYMKFL